MRKFGIINPALTSALAELGHGHTVVIADCGLPLPRFGTLGGLTPRIVDLTLVRGLPRFVDVLDAVYDELEVEGALVAEEAHGTPVMQWLVERNIVADSVSHDEFKQRLEYTQLIIRTGEDTSYANIALRCGVPF